MYTTCEWGQQVGAVNTWFLADIFKKFDYSLPDPIDQGGGKNSWRHSSIKIAHENLSILS